MMGERRVDQSALFYAFSLERHVPTDHMLRAIDRFLELDGLRAHLAPLYSAIGRPSIDPELLIRMLLVGYCFGIRSERRLCEEVHLNLAYRWFCRLGLDGDVPDHSTFSKNRHGRFRDSDLLRQLFERTELRKLIDRVDFIPLEGLGKFQLEVHGSLAALLALGQARNAKNPTAEGHGVSADQSLTSGCEVMLGAGAGFEPATFRL